MGYLIWACVWMSMYCWQTLSQLLLHNKNLPTMTFVYLYSFGKRIWPSLISFRKEKQQMFLIAIFHYYLSLSFVQCQLPCLSRGFLVFLSKTVNNYNFHGHSHKSFTHTHSFTWSCPWSIFIASMCLGIWMLVFMVIVFFFMCFCVFSSWTSTGQTLSHRRHYRRRLWLLMSNVLCLMVRKM